MQNTNDAMHRSNTDHIMWRRSRSGRSTNAMHISEIFDFEQDDMGEPEKEDTLDEALQIKSPNEILPEPIVEGSETFQKEMREMLREYIDLLQTEVSRTPARVAPLILNVDEKSWTLPKANARHRTQSTEKDKEIKR